MLSAGGVHKRSLEIEMDSCLGKTPKLSTLEQQNSTKQRYILLFLVLAALLGGSIVIFAASSAEGELASQAKAIEPAEALKALQPATHREDNEAIWTPPDVTDATTDAATDSVTPLPDDRCSEYREDFTIGWPGKERIMANTESSDACRHACATSVNCCGYEFVPPTKDDGLCFIKFATDTGTCHLIEGGTANHIGAALCTTTDVAPPQEPQRPHPKNNLHFEVVDRTLKNPVNNYFDFCESMLSCTL